MKKPDFTFLDDLYSDKNTKKTKLILTTKEGKLPNEEIINRKGRFANIITTKIIVKVKKNNKARTNLTTSKSYYYYQNLINLLKDDIDKLKYIIKNKNSSSEYLETFAALKMEHSFTHYVERISGKDFDIQTFDYYLEEVLNYQEALLQFIQLSKSYIYYNTYQTVEEEQYNLNVIYNLLHSMDKFLRGLNFQIRWYFDRHLPINSYLV